MVVLMLEVADMLPKSVFALEVGLAAVGVLMEEVHRRWLLLK